MSIRRPAVRSGELLPQPEERTMKLLCLVYYVAAKFEALSRGALHALDRL
jgi:hypothetical protein